MVTERIRIEDAVPCPMCRQRHLLGLVGLSGMNQHCWRRFKREHRQARRAS